MTPAARQDHILRMMINHEWKGGQTREALAAKWKLHERTVGDDAVVASRALVHIGNKSVEDLVNEKYAELESIQRAALEAEKPDFKAAINAIKLQLDIRGVTTIRKPKEGEAKADDARKAYEAMTIEQRCAELRAALAEEEAKLKGDMH